ncbi:uncharacterized protein JCM15063_003972 [Sporobolomyces koalae]|uniref:uncharacterized protein n=1 Tax=Sporobolomyces koalae TaxID=500713 RepID=UPI00317663CA
MPATTMEQPHSPLSPQQLPTPADSPVLRTDPAAFRLPRPPAREFGGVNQRHDEALGNVARGERSATSSRRSSLAGASESIWARGDRFIPRRRASSQTSFDLLTVPATPAQLPRSQSAPLSQVPTTGYSAHEAAAARDYDRVLRSELFGSPFRTATEMSPITSGPQRRPANKKIRRTPPSPPLSHGVPRTPQASPTVFSYAALKCRDPASTTSHESSGSPLAPLYRLSPFNPTTEQTLSRELTNPRKICLHPCRVLDAPGLSDNFYHSSLAWSRTNGLLAVALGPQVFTWRSDAQVKGVVVRLPLLEESAEVTSVGWMENTDQLAVGKDSGVVSIYDARTSQRLRQLSPHAARVGVLASQSHSLSSGSQDCTIIHRDLRMRQDLVTMIAGNKGEITALEWNENGDLASGANDNSVRIFRGFEQTPFLKLRRAHAAAVKAMAWSPHQSGLLATGGGTDDQNLRFWNTRTGTLLQKYSTGSQVCQIAWSRFTNELVSSHGFSANCEQDNAVHVWKYSSAGLPYYPIATLASGRGRMLHMALSPDGRSIVCGSSEEILRFWDLFPSAPTGTRSGQFSQADMLSGIR